MLFLLLSLFQQAYHAATVIRQMQRMALNSSSSGSGGARNPALSQSQLSTTQMTTSSSSLQCSSDSSTSGSNLPASNSAMKKWKISHTYTDTETAIEKCGRKKNHLYENHWNTKANTHTHPHTHNASGTITQIGKIEHIEWKHTHTLSYLSCLN